MTKGEKIGAVTLGALLFAGLFYFIYTTLRNPLPADYGDEFYSETLDEDLGEEALEEEVETPEAAPAAAGQSK